jgi:hypothetical protein
VPPLFVLVFELMKMPLWLTSVVKNWIPAFAGMTEKENGITEKRKGITDTESE